MTINEDILDASISHSVWLERFKTQNVNKILKLLNKADDDLIEQIERRLARIEQRGFDLGKDTTERLIALRTAIAENRGEIFRELYGQNKDDLIDFAVYESDFEARLIERSVAGAGLSVELVRPNKGLLNAVVTSQPFRGRILRDWYSGLDINARQRINDAIRLGIVEGQTTEQIVRRIRGTRANKFRDGILEISRRDASAVIRTATAHVSDRASEEVYKANSDIVKGVKWVSTLDSRTSCFIKGTPVKTPDGQKDIAEIKAGDYVMGGSGEPRLVEAIAKAKKRNLVKITLSNGESFICTDDHKFLMQNQMWLKACDLFAGQVFADILK